MNFARTRLQGFLVGSLALAGLAPMGAAAQTPTSGPKNDVTPFAGLIPIVDATPPLGPNCTASIQNRTVEINADGTFAIPNVPVDDGFYRVRVVCKATDGSTIGGQSEFLLLVPPDASANITRPKLGQLDPIPSSIRIEAPATALQTRGQTLQLGVVATLPDASTKDVSQRAKGTTYATSNANIASVGIDGLVTANARGQVIISARNEGVIASVTLSVLIPNDADHDGMTDDYERANGLDANDPTDAIQDPDGDGLSNLQEFQLGTNPRSADTDGDGLADGAEVRLTTDPLRPDTDADGLSDGQEVKLGTNPLLADTDRDGLADGLEVQLGLNPRLPDSTTVVRGRVVDQSGAPVPSASAIAFNVFTALTDSTGAFSIPVVPAGLGPIAVLARVVRTDMIEGAPTPTLLDGTSTPVAAAPAGTTDVGTIQIGVNSGVVTGAVTDPQSRSVAGALVTLTASTGDVRTVTTDPTGRYRFANVGAGALTLLASDPRTGLRGRATGVLLLNQSSTVNIPIGPSAFISGTVIGRDGGTPVSAATVRLTGATAASTLTDAIGRYSFDFVPLGDVTIDASDALGNRGRTSAALTATAQRVVADIGMLARGTVAGVVRDGAGNPAPNTTVDLNSGSIFGGAQRATTDSSGAYGFSGVFAGSFNITARSSITRTGGQASGTLDHDGQSVAVNISLAQTATLAGTVFHANSTVPFSGAQVRLSNGLSATADANGHYQFDTLPLGAYTVDASDRATGDQGRAAGSLTTQDQTQTINVTMNGLGRVTVTVRDGANALVAGARVILTGQTTFGGSFSGQTASDGTVSFDRVLAGSFAVSASAVLGGITTVGGSATGQVALNATADIAVRLQATGTVRGTVLAPDGLAAVANVVVSVSGPVSRSIVSATGGFTFALLPTGTYRLEVRDTFGNVRARASSIVLSSDGQEVRRDITVVGVGTLAGRVRFPDGSPAPGVSVQVSSSAAGLGRGLAASTDVNGAFSFAGVVTGPFTATASARSATETFFGTTSGQISSDGEQVVATIDLSANLIPSITTFYDANNFLFNVREDGSIQDGQRSVFSGDGGANKGGFLLDVLVNGAPNRFTGRGFATAEDGGREIAIQQSNLGGLVVTRKIFVPGTGYFARYLEEFSNPTDLPITVGVRLTSNFRFISKVQGAFTFNREPRIISTSSGDAMLDVSDVNQRDHWAVVDDDEDNDPFANNDLPAVALVFDGAAGALPATSAAFADDFTNNVGRAVAEWQQVTVPAGQTVALMHFASQQFSRAGARAAAERLVQLPPEALDGLSDTERSATQNFAVPGAGAGTLPRLPSVLGTSVSGRAVAGDGITAVPAVQLTFKSTNPFYGGTYRFNADGAGSFRLDSRIASGSSVPVPADAFTLRGFDPSTGALSDLAIGSFAQGVLTAAQDVTFSTNGLVDGTVRRSSGVVVSGGTVQLSGTALINPLFASIATNGTFRFVNVPAGPVTLVATVPHPQGTALTASGATVVRIGQTSTADLVVPPAGSLTGFVRRASGDPVIGLTVFLRGAGGLSRATSTDTGGRFAFTDVTVGLVTLETFDGATSTAASAQPTILADQVVSRDLTLTSGGIVTGIVSIGTQPVAGAQVTVTASNGTFSGATTADGRYSFTVNPGPANVLVTDPATGLHGSAAGTLGLAGQTLRLDIGLFAGGSVTGTVFQFGSVVPVPAARVTIDNLAPGLPRTVLTNSNGIYRFDLVPIGTFTLDVTVPSTGDRGRVSNQVNANNETRVVNVTLVGVGSVQVTVQDASNRPVGNAQVTLLGQTQFGGFQQGTTQSDGTLSFANVITGAAVVQAMDPVTGLQGSTSITVPAGGAASALVHLQAAGSLVGRVFGPGNQPAFNAVVRALGPTFRQTTTATDGSFALSGLALGTYTLDTIDGSGRIRDRQTNLTLARNDDLISQDLHQVGLGSVGGRVRSNGIAVGGASISIRSTNPVVGGFFNGTTDSDGVYNVSGVPVGGVVVTASQPANQLLGENTGQITQDGQQITVDVDLLNNAITLPVNLYDANNFFYNDQPDGSILDGTNSVFGGDFGANRGASLLDIISNGSINRFVGTSIGTREDNRREIAVRQQNVAGLDVTRKLFVPLAGYFARALEILSNPTQNAITVDVRVQDNFRVYNSNQTIQATSSGDTTLSTADAATADRWVVVGDSVDGDPFVINTTPRVGIVFDGPGAAERAAVSGSFQAGCCTRSQLTYQWTNVTIQPGQQVAYLHFYSEQTSRAAAQASADRLMSLPPEAIAGLSAAEAGVIRNFQIPAGGVSQLPALPRLDGAVSGTAFEADGTTPLPFTQVRFKSNNVFYGHTTFLSANQTGAFLLTGTADGSGNSRPVPVDLFTLQATHPNTGAPAPNTLGSFAAGQTAVVANIVFSNTGSLVGVVRRPSGAALSNGSVFAQRTISPFFSGSSQLATDGRFRMGGLPAGTYNMSVSVQSGQCCSTLTGSRTATVVNGQATQADIAVQATGSVSGVVRNGANAPAPNVTVRSTGPGGFLRQASSNAAGQFTLVDVAVGTNTLQALEPNTGLATAATIAVAADQTTTQDLMLIALGSVQLQVNFADGSPAPNAQVDIQEAPRGTFFNFGGATDGAGRVRINSVPVGAFIVRVHHPGNSSVFQDAAGTLSTNGEIVSVTVTLPRTDVLTGRVSFPDGSPSVNSLVNVFDTLIFYAQVRTDSNGTYSVAQMPFGRPLTIRAFNPNDTGIFRDVNTDGTTLSVNVMLPAVATLRVTVVQADGTSPVANAQINVRDAVRNFFRFAGTADAAGVLSIPNVPEGAFAVQAFTRSGAIAGSAGGTIQPPDHAHVVDVTIHAPLSGSVQGTVTAGDHQTPIVSAFVEVFDVDTGSRLAAASTAADGSYRTNNLVPGGSGVRVVAHSPSDFNVTASGTGSFATPGETLTIDLALPVGIVQGTVSFSDHTAVPFPNVFATQVVNGGTRTFFPNEVRADGHYNIVGVAAGTLTITAQDNESGLTGTAQGTLTDIAVLGTVDVVLPASVTVNGTVLTRAGQPVAGASVALTGSALGLTRFTQTDAEGAYTFVHMPLGSLAVQACEFRENNVTVCGSANATATTDQQTVVMTVTLPGSGTVQGTVLAPGGVVPIANAPISVQALATGPLGTSSATGTTDIDGHYSIAEVAAGAVRVTATDPSNSQIRGFADGTVAEGGTATVDVTLGNSVQLGIFNLEGTDGFRYDVFCQGALSDGGTVDRRLNDAYDGAYFLTTTNRGQTYPCVSAARLEANGRQIVIGPTAFNGLDVTRKVYSPSTGGFARYLEVLTNSTTTAVTATFEVYSNLGSDGSTRVIVDPSTTGNTYAVTDQNGFCCDPGLGHVFAGTNAAVPVAAVQFINNNDNVFYRYTLTVEPGQTAILLHFAVQRGSNTSGYAADTSGADAQAQALRDLTDPNALAGMTDDEKAQVRNFVIR